MWNTRAPGKSFRLVRSASWGPWGAGSSYLWMRKWNDTYVVGPRGGYAERGKYPQLEQHSVRHGGYLNLKEEWHDHTDPTDWFNSKVPYFIVKPDATYAPAMVDITRNNMAWGMGLGYGAYMFNDHLLAARTLAELRACFIQRQGRDTHLLFGGMMYTDKGQFTYGSVVENPCLQVYDKGIYNKGRTALLDLQRVLDVYINRHKLFESGGWGWQRSWEAGFMWKAIDRYKSHGLQGLSPHWILDTHKKIMAPLMANQNQWYRERMMKISMLSREQVTKYWKEEGLKLGFVRIAPKGTPLYNETPPVEPGQTDYDKLIRED